MRRTLELRVGNGQADEERRQVLSCPILPLCHFFFVLAASLSLDGKETNAFGLAGVFTCGSTQQIGCLARLSVARFQTLMEIPVRLSVSPSTTPSLMRYVSIDGEVK
jgi:hypothetical protein